MGRASSSTGGRHRACIRSRLEDEQALADEPNRSDGGVEQRIAFNNRRSRRVSMGVNREIKDGKLELTTEQGEKLVLKREG